MVRIQLHAFCKDTSGNYGRTIGVESTTELLKEIAIFDKEVPFSRFYTEHEILDIPDTEDRTAWEKILEDN